MNERRPSKFVYWLYGFPLLLGTAIICWRLAVLHHQQASLQWPTVNGTILQSQQIDVPVRRGHRYKADILFRYDVNGTSYLSRQISLWSADLDSYYSARFVYSHPKGTTTVYYDPDDPRNAVLLPGANEKLNHVAMGLGGIIALAGVWGILRALRRQPKLYALLNAPDALTRRIELKKADLDKGLKAFSTNSILTAVFLGMGGLLWLVTLLGGPSYTFEDPQGVNSWFPVAVGGLTILFSVFFLAQARRQARGARCPLCGAFLGKDVYSDRECLDCGTHVVIYNENGRPIPAVPQKKGKSSVPSVVVRFQQDRFVDVAGFVGFPIALVWLWAGIGSPIEWGPSISWTVVALLCGAIYYVFPQVYEEDKDDEPEKTDGDDSKEERGVLAPPSVYLVDFSVILSPVVALTSYLLYFVWEHRKLDTRGLAIVAIGFPVGIGIVTLICYLRFTAKKQIKLKLPAFVIVTLIALWLGGTFMSVVLLVWFLMKLRS
jgi:hypothetical protein